MQPFNPPGMYATRVTFLRPATVIPETQEPYSVHSPAFAVWAQSTPTATLDVAEADGTNAVDAITIRYRKTPFLLRSDNRVKPGWRAIVRNAMWSVRNVSDAVNSADECEVDLQSLE